MLNFEQSKRRSDANEQAVKKQFEKLNYSVTPLDKKPSKRKRPDFLISNRNDRPQMICEVKTIISAGLSKGVHISMLTAAQGKFTDYESLPIDLRKIGHDLWYAVCKRNELVADKPQFERLPLLVVFCLDKFAEEHLFAYPRPFDADISGILTIENENFVLECNKTAHRKVPKDFQRLCLPYAYYP
jgi:hypothetical protein